KNKNALVIEGSENPIILGDFEQDEHEVDKVAIEESGQTIVYDQTTSLRLNVLPQALDEKSKTKLYIRTDLYHLPVVIKDESIPIVPKHARDIWQEKFSMSKTITFEDDFRKAYLLDYPYVTHRNERPYFELERQWVTEGW